jgi:GTPase SAR1 family protein
MAEPTKIYNRTIEEIRENIPRFRMVVFGRANAGKTTLLQRICNSTDKPMVFKPVEYVDDKGKTQVKMEEIDASIVNPTEVVM